MLPQCMTKANYEDPAVKNTAAPLVSRSSVWIIDDLIHSRSIWYTMRDLLPK